MAYNLAYTINFTNQITENIVVEIYHKDVVPAQVYDLKCTNLVKKFINGQGDRFDTIISCELTIGIFLGLNSVPEFDDILVNYSDEWKVIVKNDSQIDFVGFLVPEECRASFRDKPYEIELTATDCLGYLRDVLLSDINGINFSGTHLLIDYLAGCLKKTNLDLDIWVYCNIYESTFFDRNAGNHTSDMFNAAKLDYRTFQQDSITFISCYDTLNAILDGGFNLFQWFGKWVIIRCGEMQGVPGPQIWHTEYGPSGNVLSANLFTDSPAQIAKQQILHPITADQVLLSRLANKSVKTIYNYDVWPEIPKNNKFERGTQFEQGDWVDVDDVDNDGNTSEIVGYYRKYTIDDWEQGKVDEFDLPNPVIGPVANKFYRKSNFNFLDTEEQRLIEAEVLNTNSSETFWMRCQPIPVQRGSKIKITLSKRSTNDFSSGSNTFTVACFAYIVDRANTKIWALTNSPSGTSSQSIGVWQDRTGINTGVGIRIWYAPNQDTTTWNTVTVESPPLPISGNMYIAFDADGPISQVGAYWQFKDFDLEYYPYVAGGYQKVKGDYWKIEQNANFSDKIEETIKISDSPVEVLKGALLRNDGITLTDRSWHRQDVAETRGFKELLNMAHYNAFRRRMWEISGTFGGTMFHPNNNTTKRFPIGFHQHYFFPNSSKLNGVYFQLVPPLELNYVDGYIRATFVECVQDGKDDGNNLGDTQEFKYIF